jgi:hypothetical protein
MNESPKNRIDKLEERLNSRNSENRFPERTSITREEAEAPRSWKEEDMGNLLHLEGERQVKNQGALFRKILFGSVIFFIISLAVALFVYFGGRNLISANNIDIEVSGPTTIAGGAELSLDVIVSNKNTTNLENVALTTEYPTGTRVAGDINTELTRDRQSLGDVKAQGKVTKTIKSVLFGEKESIKNIKLTLEYRIKGSSAIYYKEKNYDIAIKSSPVILSIDYPKEVNSGQNFQFVAEVASNSGETINNVLLSVEYPFGFTFTSSDPKPISGNSTWRIGDLPTGGKRVVKINGVLEGQNEEERTFQFSTGIASEKNENIIGANFTSLAESINIKKPFIGLGLSINGATSGNYVVSQGQKVKANIIWTNNLSAKLLDMKIEAKIVGPSFDRGSVLSDDGGYYRSIDNTIVWDKSAKQGFDEIEPNKSGVVSFTFSPLANIPTSAKNQEISISVVAEGSQLLSGIPQSVASNLKSAVKISSVLGFSARAGRSIGPFENSGPIPPKADKETTYTIIWDVTNSLNDMRNVRVIGDLPIYVTWVGLTAPASEKISFDPIARRVIWNAGDVSAGTGFSSKIREATFQVSILPSLSQVGSVPNIMTNITGTGDDSFVGTSVVVNHAPLTTRTVSDPMFKEGDENVVK